jgi:hypothetical protein
LVVLLVLDFHSLCHTWDVLCLHPYIFMP